MTALALGAAVTALFALAAFALRAVDRSGAAAGFVLALLVWAGLGAAGFILLAAFVVLGSAVTRLGYGRKQAAGLAQGHGGRRGAPHALANAGVAAACALFAGLTAHREIFTLAAAGALATALADTAGSELGQLWGRRAYLVTTWRRVAAGTDGAVSLVGTAVSVLGALLIAVLGAALGLYGLSGLAVVAAAGVAGSLVDSVLGATLERRRLLGNQGVNFLSTLAGALLAAGLASP